MSRNIDLNLNVLFLVILNLCSSALGLGLSAAGSLFTTIILFFHLLLCVEMQPHGPICLTPSDNNSSMQSYQRWSHYQGSFAVKVLKQVTAASQPASTQTE